MEEFSYNSKRGTVQYWYSDAGSDVTLVFLPGMAADHRLFDKQIDFFSDIYNCLVWDAPAHGQSRPYKNFSYVHAAEELMAILDERTITAPVLIGQSMGGYIAQTFISRYPGIVSAFVAIDSTPYGEKYYSAVDKWILRQIEWMAMLYPDKFLKFSVAKQCTSTRRSEKNMREMLNSYSRKELCHLMGIGYAGFLDENRDININCPVLIIVGKKDITGKVKQYNRRWANSLGQEIRWIENAAHNANDDQPETVNALIHQFVENLK